MNIDVYHLIKLYVSIIYINSIYVASLLSVWRDIILGLHPTQVGCKTLYYQVLYSEGGLVRALLKALPRG